MTGSPPEAEDIVERCLRLCGITGVLQVIVGRSTGHATRHECQALSSQVSASPLTSRQASLMDDAAHACVLKARTLAMHASTVAMYEQKSSKGLF